MRASRTRTGGAIRVRGAVGALLGAALLGAIVAEPLVAQVEVRTRVDTTLVTVGDRIELTVTVDHPPDSRVEWPDSVSLAPFEVLDTRIEPPVEGDGRVRSTARWALTAFELGELEIPSMDIVVRLPDGSEVVRATDRFGVEVVSVGLEEGADIVEIRGPRSIPLDPRRVAAIVALLVGLVALGVWAWRRARPGDAPAADRPTLIRPPHEVALEALDRLADARLPQRGAFKEFHIELSDILRRYVDGRFRVQALEMTTLELDEHLERVGVGDEFRRDLRTLLEQCDRVKFAKGRPSTEASDAAIGAARAWVERSAPGPAPAPSPAPDGAEPPSGRNDDASALRSTAREGV